MMKHELPQALLDWRGDVDALLTEMKRRAGVSTDTQLATALGRNQSAVSHWRRKGAVPESVLLGFDEALAKHRSDTTVRALAARAIAIRLADFMFQQNRERSPNAGRWIPHMTVALGFHSIVDAVCESLAELDNERSPTELAELLLEDHNYLAGLADWARSLPLGEAVSREARSPPAIELSAIGAQIPHSVPQSPKPKGRRR